jgi:chromosome segregation ATPase
LNIDYNDIAFKLFSDIQRQIGINYRSWKNGQKVKTEEELQKMQEVAEDLKRTRSQIVVTRRAVEAKTAELAAIREKLAATQQARTARLQALEDNVAETTKTANDAYSGFRDQTGDKTQELSDIESECNSLSVRLAREIDRFRAEIKNLSTTEKLVVDMGTTRENETAVLVEKLRQTKDKYMNARQMYEMNYQIAKEPPLEIADVEDLGSAKTRTSKGKPKGKAKGKGKGKGKDKGEAPPPAQAAPEEAT